MTQLEAKEIVCPYCGEIIVVLLEPLVSVDTHFGETYIDTDNQDMEYIEDCQVCCRPITMRTSIENGGSIRIDVFSENE